MEAADAHPHPRHFWGDAPASEEEYYAAHGILGTQSSYVTPRGITLFTRSWQPLSTGRPPRAVACMIHGLGDDVSWTFQSTPIFLAQHGFACFAADLPGHGRSQGVRALVPDFDAVAGDLLSFFDDCVMKQYPDLSALPRFLYGESLGGALCLLIHLRDRRPGPGPGPGAWAGAVLVAPMCRISDRILPPKSLLKATTFLAWLVPALPAILSADLVDRSVKVESKRAVARRNPLRFLWGKPRVGTVGEMLRVTDYLSSRLSDVALPFLVMHGTADLVTDPDVSRALHATARSGDKTIRIYDGMMHSLLYGETDENVALVRRDLLSWLNDRSSNSNGYSD